MMSVVPVGYDVCSDIGVGDSVELLAVDPLLIPCIGWRVRRMGQVAHAIHIQVIGKDTVVDANLDGHRVAKVPEDVVLRFAEGGQVAELHAVPIAAWPFVLRLVKEAPLYNYLPGIADFHVVARRVGALYVANKGVVDPLEKEGACLLTGFLRHLNSNPLQTDIPHRS